MSGRQRTLSQDQGDRPDVTGVQGQLLPGYVSRRELAAEFDVSERTIDRWVAARLLPGPISLGRKILFHLPTLEKHLADRASPRVRSRQRG
jgi:hypothetical protein